MIDRYANSLAAEESFFDDITGIHQVIRILDEASRCRQTDGQRLQGSENEQEKEKQVRSMAATQASRLRNYSKQLLTEDCEDDKSGDIDTSG
jgi:predicted xylose isomerase-like sugar epimerase